MTTELKKCSPVSLIVKRRSSRGTNHILTKEAASGAEDELDARAVRGSFYQDAAVCESNFPLFFF